jgi:hypothetical protein
VTPGVGCRSSGVGPYSASNFSGSWRGICVVMIYYVILCTFGGEREKEEGE